jgi:hypothetical protein
MRLVIAGCCFAAALAFSAGGWRSLLPRGLSLVDACARFGCGSLANTFLPVHGGDVVRLSLFGRVVPGGMLAAAGAAAAFAVARWLTLVPLGIGAAGTLPPETLAAPAVAFAVAVTLARRRPLSRSAYATATVFAAASLAARVAGAALVTGSLSTALLVVPALELAGTVSVAPANLGIAEGTAAVVLHAHGLPMGHALAVALVLHGVETAAGVTFGGTGALLLLARRRRGERAVAGWYPRQDPSPAWTTS